MINQYLLTLQKNQTHTKIINSLENIQFIVQSLIDKYGSEALYTQKNVLNIDLIFSYGMILKLENKIAKAPSHTTLRKHQAFVQSLQH